MFIREDPALATAVTLGLMRSVDSSGFKSKYKNGNIGLSNW